MANQKDKWGQPLDEWGRPITERDTFKPTKSLTKLPEGQSITFEAYVAEPFITDDLEELVLVAQEPLKDKAA